MTKRKAAFVQSDSDLLVTSLGNNHWISLQLLVGCVNYNEPKHIDGISQGDL